MKFFIPGCENDPTKTEELYKSIKDYAFSNLKWEIRDRKVRSLAYIDTTGKRDNFNAEVGKVSNDNGELVYAILETDSAFHICTKTSGVASGYPLTVNKREVLGQSYFD
jgi:hypothetical protein